MLRTNADAYKEYPWRLMTTNGGSWRLMATHGDSWRLMTTAYFCRAVFYAGRRRVGRSRIYHLDGRKTPRLAVGAGMSRRAKTGYG